MGFFKKLFGDAADELKKNFDKAKEDLLNNLEEVKQNAMAGFVNNASNSSVDEEEDEEEPKILLGDFHDSVLTIREGITELDDESLEKYKRIRKIVFPASLERLDSNVIDEQDQLEELDFSKVTKLKKIPDDFISGETKIRKFIIPNGVTEVGDSFLGDAKPGAVIFVPPSVRKMRYITGNCAYDMIVYLYAANIDITDLQVDVETLYVLPDSYAQYAKQLKESDSEAMLREIPVDMINTYGSLSNNNPIEKTDRPQTVPKVEPAHENIPEAKEKSNTHTNGNNLFSERLEAMIAAALQDGVLTDKERELLRRRVEKDGEDWDEVEMIIEARLAERNPAASAPSRGAANIISQSRTPLEEEKQAKTKEVLAIKVEKSISKKYKKTEEDEFATSIIIPEGVTIIPEYCFDGCEKLESITLPSTIKEIGEYAFCACSSLTSIEIPEGVTIIPENCFDGCEKLKSITLPTTIKQIESDAFSNCRKLKTISIPNGCERLEKIDISVGCELFLPPTLCAIDEAELNCNCYIYCFASHLEELEFLEKCWDFYVLPQYLDSYKSQAKAEGIRINIYTIREEYLYYYDN